MATATSTPIIQSLLDTDLYKLTMQAAVLAHFADKTVQYTFRNRTPQMTFSEECFQWIQRQINLLGTLKFTTEEIEYLKTALPYLPAAYFEFIATLQLKPEKQVKTTFDSAKGTLDISIDGLWVEVILYEIPILAIVSEAYFKFMDTDWNYNGQLEKAEEKAMALIRNKCPFSEFGTRRRRSVEAQDIVIRGLLEGARKSENPSSLLGTSNVFFAKKYNLKPIGTVAHEWTMAIATITNDYVNANKYAMDYWVETFGEKHVGVALTDTFGTDAFLENFDLQHAKTFAGVRQDSGDPIEYTHKIAAHYKKLGIDPKGKTIIYSDSLNVEKCLKYKAVADQYGFSCAFGVGTHFTNDFVKASDPSVKSKPLNIVIKLRSVDGVPSIKLSDDLGKNIGDAGTVRAVKQQLNYTDEQWAEGDESKRW